MAPDEPDQLKAASRRLEGRTRAPAAAVSARIYCARDDFAAKALRETGFPVDASADSRRPDTTVVVGLNFLTGYQHGPTETGR